MCRRALSCAAVVLAASCAPKQVQSPLEKAPPAEIAEARELEARGDVRAAQNAYEKFIIAHGSEVEADLARLELGMLNADLGRCQDAVPHLEQAQDSPDRAIGLRASLHLGACQVRLGDPDRALATIEPLAAERFFAEEQVLLWDTAVIASEQTTNASLGLQVLDHLVEGGGAPPEPQRTWEVVRALAQKVTLEEATILFDSLRAGALPHVAVSMRLLEHALLAQDALLIERAAEALRASDWVDEPEVAILIARAAEFVHGNPYAVGVLLPLSGRGREVGRQLLEGMQLAQLEEGGPELVVEDTGGDPDEAAAAADTLIGERGVIAVLGPVGTRATETAAAVARQSGVPLLSFSASETITDGSDEVFRLLYTPREELEALVDQARSRGLSRFIILYPDHGYGRTMERLFDQEVAAAGGIACEGVAYPPGTKSFVEYVQLALETSCDVILFADVAEQVALIAPTFAAQGAWSSVGGPVPEHVDREVHFLLPSPSWSPNLLRRAHRYLQGALITLPFHAAAETEAAERFRMAYETRYGRPPETFSAYGYDGYRMISAVLRRGHQTRQALAEALRAGAAISAVTSVDALSADGIPAHPPHVYRVRGEALEPIE